MEHGLFRLFKCSTFGPLIKYFLIPISLASELKSPLINFAGSDSTSALSFSERAGGEANKGAIILNISVKGGDYLSEVNNQGTAIVWGKTVMI